MCPQDQRLALDLWTKVCSGKYTVSSATFLYEQSVRKDANVFLNGVVVTSDCFISEYSEDKRLK